MNILVLAPMVSVALLFMITVTKLWEKSISTVIHAVTGSVAIYLYSIDCIEASIYIMLAGVLLSMARAVIMTEKDRFIKRNCKMA